jgi:tRNA(Arg) A34 adenosine deaminase TadA
MGYRNDPACTPADVERMQELASWTMRQVGTDRQSPFCADVVETATGRRLMRRLNAVAREHDPSSHAEVRVIRASTKRLKKTSLAGYTMYTTCEPCPMCMATALWAGLDRVVYGATIGDAAEHCSQIYTFAKDMVKRSDLKCEVVGPVARGECRGIFEEPRMLEMTRLWRKSTVGIKK